MTKLTIQLDGKTFVPSLGFATMIQDDIQKMIDETYLELQPQEEKTEETLAKKLRVHLTALREQTISYEDSEFERGMVKMCDIILSLLNELEDKNTITGVFDNAEDLMKHLDSLKEKEQPETDELIKENIRVMDEQDGNISTLAPEELKPTIVKVGDKTFEITIKSI